MRRLIYLIVITVVLLCSCRRDPVWQTLDIAEDLMEEYPDSALTILNDVDGKKLSGETQARYALLLSQAYDKNYIDLTNDSLISIAVEFYSRSDDRRHRMLAYYYQSVINLNGRYFESGLRSALKALDIAKELNDMTYLSRTETIIGRLYSSTYNFKSAYEWDLRALEHAKIAGLNQWFPLLYENIGTELQNLQYFRESIEYLDSATMYSETPVLDVLETLYISHYFLNNFSAADSVYNEIIQAGFQPPIGVINCMARNHPEDALNLFNEYAKKNNMPLGALDMDFTIAIAYIKKGDIDSAIQSMDRFITSQNSLVSNMGAHLLDKVRHEHDIEITHEQAERARYYRRVSLITLLILSLLITLGILIITRFRNRQKMQRLQLERNLAILEGEYNFIKSQLEHSVDKIAEKQKRIVSLEEEVYGLYARNDEQIIADQNKSISSLTEQVDNLRRLSYQTFLNQFSWIDKLGTRYIREKKITTNGEKTFYDFVAKEISKQFSNNRFIEELSDMIAQYDETILEEIKQMFRIKSEQEVLICFMCGISPALIAILLNKSTRAIYNLKARIKEKLTSIDSPISHKIFEMIKH